MQAFLRLSLAYGDQGEFFSLLKIFLSQPFFQEGAMSRTVRAHTRSGTLSAPEPHFCSTTRQT